MGPIQIETIGEMITIKQTTQCLQCSKTVTDDDEYQLIFDETGQEINIQNLLKECCQIYVDEDKNKFQALCGECLNDLIETFDIIEYERNKIDLKSSKEIVHISTKTSEIQSQSPNSKNGNDDSIKLQEFNHNIEQSDDYIYDEHYYIMKTGNELQIELQGDLSKEILSEDTNIEYIIEEDIVEIKEDDILTEYTIENENIPNENIEKPSLEVQSIVEIQNKEKPEHQNKHNDILSMDCNDENCDDPIETHEEYEIDYLDDDIDDLTKLNDYMNKSICSNFKDITFPEPINCRLCNETLDKHANCLDHCKDKHNNENDSNYICVIDENCDNFNNIEDLSNHLVFKHYDLDSLTVYSQCLFCTKRFSNVITFNKHSCYNNKSTSRSTTECNLCSKTFRSNKRYRFHLQFHLEKHRPKACLICRKFFEDDDELFEHIMYEREPKDALICKLCDRNFILLDTFENHKSVHHLKRPYACTFCEKTYLSSQQLQDHLNAQHIQKNIYKCKTCGKEFFKRNILQKHLLNHKEPVEVSVVSCSECGFIGQNHEIVKKHISDVHKNNKAHILSSMHTIAYCCEYCERAFNSCDNLLLHRNTQHKDKLFQCQLCTFTVDTFKKAKVHRQTHQKMNELRRLFPVVRHYVCNIESCTSSYAQWITLMSHKRNTHLIGKQKPFKCEQCDETFNNRRNVNQHIQEKHKKTSTFPCPFCPKIYTTPMAIAVHIARMHNNNKLACEHCGTLCKNKDALDKHIVNTHAFLKCDLCEKVLKNMKNLKTHIKMVHKKEKRYFCQYCKRGYYNNCDRLTHEQAIHIKNKVFNCNICTYTTPYRESIIVHQKNHNNAKPYECNLCTKKFARKYSLTLHLRRHADVRRFICPYDCNSSYPNQGILNLHMRTKHADETTLLSKEVQVKKKKLSKILKKGIPIDYLAADDEENELNFIDEVNSDAEEIFLFTSDNSNHDNDVDDDNINKDKNNIIDDNEIEENDNNIDYVLTNDDVSNVIDDEQSIQYNRIDEIDMEGVEIEDVGTIILNENDENTYILKANGEIQTYEIIEH